MDKNVKFEFAVQMHCQKCADSITTALQSNSGVSKFSIDLPNEKVIVEGALPSHEVQSLLESTGRRAVLQGMGSSHAAAPKHMGAAVAMVSGVSSTVGVLRFVQTDEQTCVIEGTVDGLSPGAHALNIHEFGDLSDGCNRCGEHYNPYDNPHGAPFDTKRHVGDLGNVIADNSGRTQFRLQDEQIKVWDVIGRSVVIHALADDLGRGGHTLSNTTGNSGPGVACGIIARSAGLFQNSKKLCTCDGVTLWDERDVPPAGPQRQRKARTEKDSV